MNTKYLITMLAFILAIQNSTAEVQAISEIRLNITGSGLVSVTEDITILDNETTASINLPEHKNLEIYSSGIAVPYTEIQMEKGVTLNIGLAGLPSDVKIRDIIIKYDTQHLTSKNGSVWALSFNTKATPRKTIVKLYLPKNSTIFPLSKDLLFSIDSDSLWLYPQEEEFNFTLNYEYAGGTETTLLEEDSAVLQLILVSLPAALVLAAVIYYLIKRRSSSKIVGKLEVEKDIVTSSERIPEGGEIRKTPSGVGDIEFEFKTEKTTPKIKSTVLNVLDDSEKNIVSLLQEHGPEDVTQAFLYKTTRIPKSSLSELIKRLEKRNVIECHREGRVNWIRIKKWTLD